VLWHAINPWFSERHLHKTCIFELLNLERSGDVAERFCHSQNA